MTNTHPKLVGDQVAAVWYLSVDLRELRLRHLDRDDFVHEIIKEVADYMDLAQERSLLGVDSTQGFSDADEITLDVDVSDKERISLECGPFPEDFYLKVRAYFDYNNKRMWLELDESIDPS